MKLAKKLIALCTIAIFVIAIPGFAELSPVQTQAGADSNVAVRLQYRVTIAGDLAVACTGQDNFGENRTIFFERHSGKGWQSLEPESRGNPAEISAGAFSYAVALDGDYAVVGAEWHDNFKGAAYIFKRGDDGWFELQKLSPPDLGRFDHFGSSVSISGDIAIVGTTWQNLFRGAVYIFKLIDNEWLLQQKITPPGAVPESRFGADLKIDGDEITIVANPVKTAVKQVYSYRQSLDTWTEQQKAEASIVSLTGEDSDNYGMSAAPLGNLIDALDEAYDDSDSQPVYSADVIDPPDSMFATDGAYEDRVEIMWKKVDLDAIIYKILRNDTLISITSSEDSLYADGGSRPGDTCNYCVVVSDMAEDESVPACDEGSRIIFPPISFSASDGEYDKFVRLTWIDMSFIEAGFSIHRNTEEIAVLDANSTLYDDTTAEVGISYYYEVIAFDADGNTAVPKGDDGFRGAILPPLIVSASDGEYKDSVIITWKDQAENETGYAVYRNDTFLAATNVDIESYADLTAPFGDSSEYCVRTLGEGSVESIPVCDWGGIGILPAPDSVSASDAMYDDRIEITWKDPSNLEDGFRVYRDDSLIATTPANVKIYKDFLAEPNVTHRYCVVAFSNEGGKSDSTCDDGFQSFVLAPDEVTATDGEFENRVEITWKSRSTTALLFNIFRDDTFIKSVSSGGRSYSDYGGTAGQEYNYSVRAVMLDSTAVSEPDMGSRELLPPTDVNATIEEYEDKIVVTWTDNSSIEHGYDIYRDDSLIDTRAPNENLFTDWTAASGITYNYKVVAFDSLGETRGESEPGIAPDGGRRVILKPDNLRATDGRFEDRVELTWKDNSSAEDGYNIYRDGNLIGTTPDNYTSFTDFTPQLEIESEYSIRAFDAYGESNADSDFGFASLMSPVSVNASDLYTNKVVLSWVDQSENETGYEILRNNVPIGTTPSNVNTFTDIPPGIGSPFNYCVRSLRGFGRMSPVYMGSYDTPDAANGVAVAGNYAYVADDSGGLQIVDISNPAHPELTGSCDTPDRALSVAVKGNYAYVADNYSGLQVIDVSNPRAPAIVRAYDTPGIARGVAINGNYLYVADNNGLFILNISQPSSPDSVGYCNTPNAAVKVAISGNRAYIADQPFGLQVIDISNPAAPVIVGSCETPGGAWGVAVSDDSAYAYIADYTAGLTILEIDGPGDPVIVGGINLGDQALSVAISDGYAYVACDEAGILVIDVGDPASPAIVGSYDTPDQAWHVVISGGLICVADIYSGLQVLKKGGGPENDPVYTGSCETGYYITAAAIKGNYAYLADNGDTPAAGALHVVNISNPENPTHVSTYDLTSRAKDIAISGNYAYVANYYYGLKVFDISQPVAPKLIGEFDTPNYAFGVALKGDFAYVADCRQGLQVIDISNPANPAGVGQLDTPGRDLAVTISGDYAITADDSLYQIRLINISDPENPSLVATYDTPDRAYDVAAFGNYVFVAAYKSGLLVIDVSDPANPSLVGDCNTPGDAFGVTVAGDYAYVADSYSGLEVIDISDPQHPRLVGNYDTPGASDGAAVSGDFAYIADGSSLQVLKIGSSSEKVCDEGGYPGYVQRRDTTDLDIKLYADDPAGWEFFGWSVAISGDYAIVGAKNDTTCGVDAGAAYILERGADGKWSKRQKLMPSDAGAKKSFGWSVAISGDYAIVGANGFYDNNFNGAAYIFERNANGNWSEKEILTPSDATSWDKFGNSVAISGDFAIVGAPVPASGSAYIFKRDAYGNWIQKNILREGEAGDKFGFSVAISGDYAIVGAPLDYCTYPQQGSAYIFERASDVDWVCQLPPLVASDGAYTDEFGYSVAISGDIAVVGAPNADTETGANAGKVYVFKHGSTGWSEEKMLPGTGESHNGYCVGISGDKIIAGRPIANRAFIYDRADSYSWNWLRVRQYGQAGYAVAISGDVAIIGAPYDNENTGAVYILSSSVMATDGTPNSRIRISWQNRWSDVVGFKIYRDDSVIATVGDDIEVFEDFSALPGRSYEYCVEPFTADTTKDRFCDFGCRPPNGNITGNISAMAGAGVEDISVALSPQPNRSLLFDGASGHVRIPDTYGKLKFDNLAGYTIEGWIKYSGNDYRTVLAKGLLYKYPFRLVQRYNQLQFVVGDGNTLVNVLSTQTDLNDDKWHHFACVHDAENREIRLYVDSSSAVTATYTDLGFIDNDNDLTMGLLAFKGQLDEIRIWNCARDSAQIDSTMNRLLTGDEEGLIAYWPLDEGGGYVITDESGGKLYGTFKYGVYWAENTPPLAISTPTDTEGNYVVENIRYSNETTDETPFEVRPFLGQKQFTPAFKKITLSGEHPVENQVNFIETTAFTASGEIRFAGTDCPVPNVEIRVDGQFRGATDKNGKFSVSVDNDVHKIEPFVDGHKIAPAFFEQLFEDDVSGIDFIDSTTRILSGNVGGGCGRYVGDVTVHIRSENNCLDTTLTVDSEYSIALPPQKYMVRASVVESTIPEGLIGSDVVNFFAALGTREVDLTDADGSLDFVYRAPLQVTIKFPDSAAYLVPCALTFDGRTLPESLLVIPQLEVIHFVIEVNEKYGNNSYCPLDKGTVRIYDEIFDIEDSLIELEVINGEATYTTFACTPSLSVGRVDPQGNDRSFQKALRATVYVEGRQPITATEWVLVTGHIAPEGADFITATTDMPLYILRDPPGDNSYAYIDSNKTVRWNCEYDMNEVGGGLGVKVETWWGIDQKFFFGIGVGKISEVELKKTTKSELMVSYMTNWESRTDVTATMRKRFSTSADELFVGEGGDVFIGMGFNFIFSRVGVVEVDYENCIVKRRTAFGFEPDSIETIYSYTYQYIEDVLIPDYNTKIDYFDSLYPPDPLVGPDGDTLHSDSGYIFLAKQDFWYQILAENDTCKMEAEFIENRSFSSGADFSDYCDTMTTKSFTRIGTFTTDLSSDFAGFGVETDWGGVAVSFPIKVHYQGVFDYEQTEYSSTEGVGYVLSDNDIGDHFTVDIKADTLYAGPVFDVLAGVSSCPWEPWYDLETGEARMMYRDEPDLKANWQDADLVNVPPDEPVVLNLLLENNSPTGDTRVYVLREVTTSNPDGAVIKANGVWLNQGVSYYIDANVSQNITMTVERGPTRYNYKDLAVMAYAPCEWDLWSRGGVLNHSDILYFDVSFYAPCSDIRLMRPESGWIYNKDSVDAEEPITAWLTNYELEISDSVAVHYVGFQYRRLGTGPEGPSEWVDVYADSLGEVQTDIDWFPDDTLADGVYELRAFTDCNGDNNGGRGFSSVSTGTIDRHAPLVFGKPQPADSQLSLGEDISITFNEPIDCRSVLADSISLVYLDGPNAGDTIPVDIVCSGISIIITPDPDSVTAADLEDRVLEATVRGVRDKANNRMEEAATWAFLVRQSVFTWQQENLICDVAYRDPGSITADLVNGGDSAVVFEISNLPDWITEVAYASDTLPPGGKHTIKFTIEEAIDLGSYEHQVTASCATGVTYLNILLTVSCHEPVWAFDRRKYEHTMTIVAQVDIDGILSDDPGDRIAAYVGNQLRGVANLEQVMGDYMAFLTVYSNRSSGETMRFQVWDADSCKLYNSTLERFAFVTNGRVGSPDYPVTLTATDVLPDTVQVVPLTRGWNWFSTRVQAIDMSVNGVLSYLTPATGDIIKSQTAFAEFDPDMGWVGTLQLLDNVSGYMIKLSEPGTIFLEGSIADPLTTSIPVYDGWNWVSYLPDTKLSVATALQDLNSILVNKDMVKSQTAFSQCFKSGNSIFWYGDLDSMESNKGYKLYLYDGSKARDGFRYPSFGGGAAPLLASGTGQNATRVSLVEESEPGWTINRSDYQYNMTLTAVLNIVGEECRKDNVLIGAFVDGECRGMGRPIYLAGIDRYLAFIMVHSNQVTGETVDFQAFVPETRAVYNVDQSVLYEADAALATVREPFLLNASSIAYEVEDVLPLTYSLSQNYPNPFNPMTVIDYSLPVPLHVRIDVFNILGQKVRTLVNESMTAGRHRIQWDGTDAGGNPVSTGIYFYRVEAGDYIETKKMMILK